MQDISKGSKKPSDSASTNWRPPRKRGSARSKKFTMQHLYTKGNVFYFRFAFPRHAQIHFGRREYRCSLQTGYLRTARSLAATIYGEICLMMKHPALPTFDDFKDRMDNIRELNDKFYSLVDANTGKSGNLLTQEDIRLRMNGYLRAVLDDDSQNVKERIGVLEHTDGRIKEILDTSAYAACTAEVLQTQINYPDGLKELAPRIIVDLVKFGVFKPHEIRNENVLQIANEYLKMQITIKKVIQARENGDYMFEQPLFSMPYKAGYAPSTIEEQPTVTQKTLLLTEFLDKYIKVKISDRAWEKHTVRDHVFRLNYLFDILGNRNIYEITREDMRYFREILTKLPPNRKKSKKYAKMDIKEILASKPEQVLNVKTINIITGTISSMFEWGVREGILDKNPARGLEIRDDRKDISLKEAFSREDIQAIFHHQAYLNLKTKAPSMFWIPLIALYTGMRLEEICQLCCDDVYCNKVDGVWVFDLNERLPEGETVPKKLKTKNAPRRIPIHADLKTVGFLDYFERVKGQGAARLFPDLTASPSSPKYGKLFGKRFSTFLKSFKISGKKSFHSFRHTFSDYFKNIGLQNDVFTQIFGHEGGSLAVKQYGSEFSPKKCYDEIISKLDYGLKLDALRH